MHGEKEDIQRKYSIDSSSQGVAVELIRFFIKYIPRLYIEREELELISTGQKFIVAIHPCPVLNAKC